MAKGYPAIYISPSDRIGYAVLSILCFAADRYPL